MSVLRSRLFEMEREKQAAEVAAKRKSQVSAADKWCQADLEGRREVYGVPDSDFGSLS